MSNNQKEVIDKAAKAIDELIECFAKSEQFSLERFQKVRKDLANLSETLKLNQEMLDAMR